MQPAPLSAIIPRALSRLTSLRAASGALLLLCLFCYLPGVLLVPPVDRTEVVFASGTQDLVARDAWTNPRFDGNVSKHHPIGTYWAQSLAARIFGADFAHEIAVYRLPSLIAVTAAVLAVLWLAAPLIGTLPALLAAAFLAVSPLTALVAHLAVADGLAFGLSTIAMLALMRIYCAASGDKSTAPWLILWLALGLGMLVNALQLPLLIAVTAIVLSVWDKSAAWLRTTRPLPGLLVTVLLAAPWLVIRAMHDGGMPYSGLPIRDAINAWAGAQHMNLRAFPGTFLLATIVGFLPATAVLADSAKRAWGERDVDKLSRFLIAWTLGYLVFLELLSSKPATYMVQAIFPALAIMVARLVATPNATRATLRFSLIPPPIPAALMMAALLLVPCIVTQELPGPLAIVLIGAVATLAAIGGRMQSLTDWAAYAIATYALFTVTLLAVIMPSIDKFWPSREIARAVSQCTPGPTSLIGFREPSASFMLGADRSIVEPNQLSSDGTALHVVESRWLERYRTEMRARGLTPTEAGCVEAVNTMRGCELTFTLMVVDPGKRTCALPPKNACATIRAQTRPTGTRCD